MKIYCVMNDKGYLYNLFKTKNEAIEYAGTTAEWLASFHGENKITGRPMQGATDIVYVYEIIGKPEKKRNGYIKVIEKELN